MDIQDLKKAIPGISAKLGEMMATAGLSIFQDAGLTLEQATPSVGITLTPRDGSEPLRITLSVEAVDRDSDEP